MFEGRGKCKGVRMFEVRGKCEGVRMFEGRGGLRTELEKKGDM